MQVTPCFTQSQVTPSTNPSAYACCAHSFTLLDTPDRRRNFHGESWLRLLLHFADAILGALSQPDIGQLFPDSDPKWKGQTSDVFVKEAVST